jgi:hypothetical protein
MQAIEEVPLHQYIFIYLLAIVIFAAVYYILPSGSGLISSQTPPEKGFGFLTSVYFSATTITTLCYGDVYPVGFSRAVAAFQGLVGLTIFGIMLAKVSSIKLSHHAHRLFLSHSEERFEKFSVEVQQIENEFQRLQSIIPVAFPVTPLQPNQPVLAQQAGQNIFIPSFSIALSKFHSFSFSLCDCFNLELDEGFISDFPERQIVRVTENTKNAMFRLKQIFLSLTEHQKSDVLTAANLRMASELLYEWQKTDKKISSQSKNEELKKGFKPIGNMATSLLESFFSVPRERTQPPDQEFRAGL